MRIIQSFTETVHVDNLDHENGNGDKDVDFVGGTGPECTSATGNGERKDQGVDGDGHVETEDDVDADRN